MGPSSSFERKVRIVTSAGKNTPTTANTIAASRLKSRASNANGAASTNRSVAVGMLIAAPERASSVRSPMRAAINAMPKHSALSTASVIATVSGRRYLSSISTKRNSKALALMTLCATPFGRA